MPSVLMLWNGGGPSFCWRSLLEADLVLVSAVPARCEEWRTPNVGGSSGPQKAPRGEKALLLLRMLLLTGALTGFPKAGLAFLITLQCRALWRLA